MDLSIDTPESLAWQAERSAAAEAALAALPGRDVLTARIAANLADTRQTPVVRRGARWFQKSVVDPAAEQPVAVVRDTPSGSPRVLLDPNELSAKRGAPVDLQQWFPSPDGTLLAAIVTQAGLEIGEVVLIDVATGSVLPDAVPWNVNTLAWKADSSGFWCSILEVVDGAMENRIHPFTVGGGAGEALACDVPFMQGTPIVGERHTVVRTGNTEPRIDWLVVEDHLEPLLRDLPGGFAGTVHGDDLIVMSDHQAPRGRLLRIPIATASDQSTWVELRAESEDVLRHVGVVGDTVVLGYIRDACSGFSLLDLDGRLLEEIALPGRGTASAWPFNASHPAVPMCVEGDDEISFLFSTFGQSWAVYRYAISDRHLDLVVPPAVDIPDLVVTAITARSSDGALVPAHVVHRADVDTSVPQPTLLYGYGGFNLAYLPGFGAESAAWVQSGGVYVLAHLRGGSELGSDWWRQGRRERKQQTFDDLYAVAESLIASGTTTSARLAVKGESNGGLLTSIATVQRPDLWAAVVSDVPVTDLLGFVRDPFSYLIGREEYGDPTIPEEAEWLRAISPVHNVQAASYPPILLTAGANDPRCPAWHARSFAGLLAEHNTGESPVLLRIYADQGHNVSGLGEASGKSGDWLSFLADAAGLRV